MAWQIKTKTLEDYSHRYKVSKNGCWEWVGHLNAGGYGTTLFGSRIDGSRKQMLAHRVFYLLTYGEFDTNLNVCHTCDNRRCVNPKHLFLGTQKDNMQDCASKGRIKTAKGELNPRAKLKYTDVEYIRNMLARGHTQKSLANRFGVNQTLISAIKRKKIWI